MSNIGEINIQGTLNAATIKGIIAKAEQISIKLPYSENDKDYAILSDYIHSNIQFKSAEYITEYISNSTNTLPALFLATTSFGAFVKKHFYYYYGIPNSWEDLTPEGGTGDSSVTGIPVLTVQTIFEEEYNVGENIEVTYSWVANGSNTGYGRVYGLIDGATVLSRRELPSNVAIDGANRTWLIQGLPRGKHKIEMYVTDSGNNQSWPRFSQDIQVGGLEIISSFNSEAYYYADEDLTIPFEVLDNSELPYKVYASWDNQEIFEADQDNVVITGAKMTPKTHTLTLQAKTYEIVDGNEVFVKSSNILKLSVIAAKEGEVYVSTHANSSSVGGDQSLCIVEENQQVRFTVNIVEIHGTSFTVNYYLIPTDESFETPIGDQTLIKTITSNVGLSATSLIFDTAGKYLLRVSAISNYSGETGHCDFKCSVTESSLLTIDPIVDNSLQLWLDATGRTNSLLDKEIWTDKSGNNIPVKLHDFNYNTNGWVTDEDGVSKDYLLINSRAFVEIDLEPFYNDVTTGLTVDVEFETEDISNVNARVISCYGSNIGFFANTDTARLGSSASPSEVSYTDKVDSEGNVTTIKTGPFEVNFRQRTKTHLTFCISKYNENLGTNNPYPISLMTIYVNGVMSGIQELTGNDNFKTNKWQKIYLGCNPVESSINAQTGPTEFENFGEAKIYNLRVYNRALTMEEIVTNFVSDIKDPVEKDLKVRSNKLGEAATDSTLVIPEMTFNMFEADFNNVTKDDKQRATVQYSASSGSVQSIDEFGLVQWQGTSTLAYAVKNYRLTFYDKTYLEKVEELYPDLAENEKVGRMFEDLEELGKKKKYNIGNGVGETRFTLKADYMDSAVARNTATAMFIGDMGTEETPAQEFINSARTAIYGFPMRLYINKIPDTAIENGLPIETEGTKESLGIFNFNLDKGATDSLGLYYKEDIMAELDETPDELNRFIDSYPYFDTLSFEISANSDTSAGAFAQSDYDQIITDFEYRFPDEDDLEETNYYGTYVQTDSDISLTITNKYELDEDGITVVPTDRISNNLITGIYVKQDMNYVSPSWTLEYVSDGIYKISNYLAYTNKEVVTSELYLNFVETDPVNRTGYVIFTESSDQAYMNCRVHLKRLIDWVKDADDDRFYAEFEKHFNLSTTLDYYLLVLANGMVDNLGKNMMLDSYGPGKTGRKYTTGNNLGEEITYTEEEIAQYDNYIWYPHFYDMDTQLSLDNSGNMRFDTDIEMVQGVFNTSKSLLWTKFSRCFHTEIYDRYVELRTNKTFTVENFMKYYYDNQISLIPEMDYNNNFYNKYLATKDRRAYLFMMHGRQYEYMYKWIEERLYFLDTYFSYGKEYTSQCTVRVEYNDYQTTPVTFNIQTYIPSYVYVIFKNSGTDEGDNYMTVRKKVGRGQTVEFSQFISTSTDQEIIIYNASNLKDIGDISIYTPKTVLMDQAVKITKLTVGTDEHPNPNLQQLTLSNNTYLTKLIADNCTSLSYSLNLTGCKNLEKLSLKGSSVTSVDFPDGAPLKEIILPEATTSIKLKNMAILDDLVLEGSAKLTSLEIINCPKLTGYKVDDGEGNISYVEGPLANTILNTYTPTNTLTRINLEVYGYNTSSKFLDAAASLANLYPENFNIRGRIRYTGSTIPDKYSYFKENFPDLLVTYPNVNNVSNMFENYKNINLVWSRKEKRGEDDNIIESTYYYWTDLKEGQFDADDYVTYEGVTGRSIDAYDDDDMKKLADEIKLRLEPFEKFTNVSSMFRNVRVMEYLHDDTFDHIDLSSANTNYMFDGCNLLKYFEIPKSIKSLGPYMFGNCYRALIYIPNQVNKIDSEAFASINYEIGAHPVLLFEATVNRDAEEGIRDARYGIDRGENGRAMQREETIIGQTPVYIDYFQKDSKRLIYNISSVDGTDITEEYLNLVSEDITDTIAFNNPLNVSEFLHGSLCNFTNLQHAAIPAFAIPGESDSFIYPLQPLECSIARLFKDNFVLSSDRNKIKLNTVYVLPSDSDSLKIGRYFLQDTAINTIYISPEVKEIEQHAFEKAKATSIEVLGARTAMDVSLQKIGYRAFAESGITRIYIPDTVIDIGDMAFAGCQDILELKYSTSMTYISKGCFSDCATNTTIVESITGFSSNITTIDNAAFRDSINLQLFKPIENPTTPFDCYFICDESRSKNINYFTNLEYIGGYAFQKILNITRLDISDSIKYIGECAFRPYHNQDFTSVSIADTLINWTGSNYSSLEIGNSAFIYRQLNWLCDKEIGNNNILYKSCYIPKVSKIGNHAFTPYINENDYTGAALNFLLTPAKYDYAYENWGEIATNHLETIYEYVDLLISRDDYNRSNFMYIIKQNQALAGELLLNGEYLPTQAYIPATVVYNNTTYPVTEILPQAFVNNDSALNNIYFDKDSQLRRIGAGVFKTSTIFNIAVIDPETGDIVLDENNEKKLIPSSIIVDDDYPTPIGDGIPFKSTQWYLFNSVPNDFIYLNEYCLGYDPNNSILEKTTNIKETTKVIYENAFANESFNSFDLPENLVQIRASAFANCNNILTFNFNRCASTLTTIEKQAFYNCSLLNKVSFTPAIRFVGKDAFGNCPNLQTIEYADGMIVTAQSDPLSPVVDDYDRNEIISKIVISDSMGSFFSPYGSGFNDFKTLKNIKYLTLSTIEQTMELPLITSDGAYSDLYDPGWTENHYVLDFNDEYLKNKYPEATYAGEYLRIVTTDQYFDCPKGNYTANIDISNVTVTYDDLDIVRILLGLSTTVLNTLTLKKTLAARINASKFSNIREKHLLTLSVKSD